MFVGIGVDERGGCIAAKRLTLTLTGWLASDGLLND